jgi:hypothetical protein
MSTENIIPELIRPGKKTDLIVDFGKVFAL